jgi:hypothetical protein
MVYTVVAHCPESNDCVNTRQWFMMAAQGKEESELPNDPWEVAAECRQPVGYQVALRPELDKVKFSKMLSTATPREETGVNTFEAKEVHRVEFVQNGVGEYRSIGVGRVFDPDYPAPGTLTTDNSAGSFSIFRHSFGVPFSGEDGKPHVRSAHPSELMSVFGLPVNISSSETFAHGPCYPVLEVLQRLCPTKTAQGLLYKMEVFPVANAL